MKITEGLKAMAEVPTQIKTVTIISIVAVLVAVVALVVATMAGRTVRNAN